MHTYIHTHYTSFDLLEHIRTNIHIGFVWIRRRIWADRQIDIHHTHTRIYPSSQSA